MHIDLWNTKIHFVDLKGLLNYLSKQVKQLRGSIIFLALLKQITTIWVAWGKKNLFYKVLESRCWQINAHIETSKKSCILASCSIWCLWWSFIVLINSDLWLSLHTASVCLQVRLSLDISCHWIRGAQFNLVRPWHNYIFTNMVAI